jgi:hypothetical protein
MLAFRGADGEILGVNVDGLTIHSNQPEIVFVLRVNLFEILKNSMSKQQSRF